jgi:hypothetical protein
MPDPMRQTISATEASVLFDANPYETKWMLYRKFAHGEEARETPHARMDWGQRLEPLVIQQAAADLRFEVKPNNSGSEGRQAYVRRGLLGCTRDAEIICPDRGPGALETKCVFEYPIWMQEWGGGNAVPRHIEIQVQTQMHVGDGAKPYAWGVIAVWIAGEVIYFERTPVPKFIDELERQAALFFEDVKNRKEPEPFGIPQELPLLDEAFPIKAENPLDMREVDDGRKLAEDVRMLAWHRREKSGHDKAAEALQARLRGVIKDHDKLLLPHGINLKQKQVERKGYQVAPSSYRTLTPYVPDNIPIGAIDGQ